MTENNILKEEDIALLGELDRISQFKDPIQKKSETDAEYYF